MSRLIGRGFRSPALLLTSQEMIDPWYPSVLTSKMEKVVTLFYRAIMKIKSDIVFLLPSIVLSLIMAESGRLHMNGK